MPVTVSTFWSDTRVKTLTPKAKLALAFCIFERADIQPIILEDMALATGLDLSECEGWIEFFQKQGMIEQDLVGVS